MLPLPGPLFGLGDRSSDLIPQIDQVLAVDHDGSLGAAEPGVPAPVDTLEGFPPQKFGLDGFGRDLVFGHFCPRMTDRTG